MRRPPGGDYCRFFNSPVRSRRMPRSFRSNYAHSTTACSIETWRCCVTASIRRLLAPLMGVGSPSPSVPRVALLLRRGWAKYRDFLILYRRAILQQMQKPTGPCPSASVLLSTFTRPLRQWKERESEGCSHITSGIRVIRPAEGCADREKDLLGYRCR
jgi:hypothetical protein